MNESHQEGRGGGREEEERGGEGWLSGYKKKIGGCVAEVCVVCIGKHVKRKHS